MTPAIPLDEVLARLERLWRKLDDEGRYTDANTVSLAIEAINAGKVKPVVSIPGFGDEPVPF